MVEATLGSEVFWITRVRLIRTRGAAMQPLEVFGVTGISGYVELQGRVGVGVEGTEKPASPKKNILMERGK